jgi:hypothetical protein
MGKIFGAHLGFSLQVQNFNEKEIFSLPLLQIIKIIPKQIHNHSIIYFSGEEETKSMPHAPVIRKTDGVYISFSQKR